MSDVYLWETYDKLGRDALETGDLEQANEAFRSAVATAEEIQAPDRLVLSLRNLAATMQDMNQIGDAHELLLRTQEVAREQLGEEHSQTVETWRDLSQVCRHLGYLDQADQYLKQVLEQDIKSQDTELIGSTLLSLAQISQAKNEPAVAAAYLQRVVKLKRQKHGDNHPEIAQPLLWLATALYQCGKATEAQSFMRTALGLLERHFADEPLHLAQSLLAGAKLMVDAGQFEVALTHQKRALDLLNSELQPEDEKLWETREYIATTLAAMGKLEEAIELLEFCLRNGEPQGAQAGATYKNLAGLYLALNQTEKAEELYLKATEILEVALGNQHPAYLATLEERIQLYHFSGRTKEALELALKTIRATEDRFGPGHPNTAQVYASTALLAHGAEEWETALELMHAAEKIWSSLDPRPEDVLANCHANIATCLIRLGRRAEAEPSLVIAESWGNEALKPVLAELRAELGSDKPPITEEPKPQELTLELEPDTEVPESPESFESSEDDEFALPDLFDDDEETPQAADESTEERELTEEPEPVPGPELIVEPEDLPEKVELFEDEDDYSIELFTDEPSEEKTPPTLELEEVAETFEEENPEALEEETEVAEDEPQVPEEDVAAAEEELEASSEPAFVYDPESPDFVDRRTSPRCPLSFNRFFEIHVASESGSEDDFKSYLVDLSQGGIRINSEVPFPLEYDLTVTLPEDVLGEKTTLDCQVVWQKALYGASFIQGLAFKDLTETQQKLIDTRVTPENGASRSISRQHFRLYRPFPIKLKADGHEEWLTSYATDLSVNGIGTRLAAPLEQGNPVRVRLELEFELPTVEVEARVAWSKSGDNGVSHGLQFADVGPVEARTIKRYIDRCLEFLPD